MQHTLLYRAAAAALSVSVCASTMLAAPASRPTTRDVQRKLDDRELEEQMLGEMAKDLYSRAKDRMTESAKKLKEEFDPGRETQEIQNRIVADIEEMLEKLVPPRDQPPSPEGEGPRIPGEPRPRSGQQELAKGPLTEQAKAAEKSNRPEDAPMRRASSKLVEDAPAFLQICPRVGRQALIEGAGEEVSEKYREMTEAYYRAVATRAGR